MDDLTGIIHLYHLSFSSVTFSLIAALAGGIFFAYTSGYLLWLTPQQRVATFIVGFALTASFAIVRLGQPLVGWREALLFDSFPLLLCVAYFLPTITAVANGSEVFQAAFLLNLFFGWTGVGWIAAMVLAFRPSEHDLYADLNIRLTPFGAMTKSAIPLGLASQGDKQLPAVSNVYVPPLRREV